jgi:CheY-like chemotaxis protein
MSPSSRRILIVEDSDEVRELLLLILEGDGFVARACEDAEQALVMAHAERPDLVLTDLMLGASSGLDLITRMRSDLAPPVPPIVACSGFTRFECEALERGAAAFIPKPFEPSIIRSTVTAVLARRNLAQRDRDQAVARSRSLRARAVDAARVAMGRLERLGNLPTRAHASADFLPGYFGFGEAFTAVLRDQDLHVLASSNEARWRPHEPLELSLCRDIMETISAILVPDLQSLGAVAPGPDGEPLRFFAGVPLFCGAVAVGVSCFVDNEPRHFGPDDYWLMETFGRRASAVMSGHESTIGPIWTPSGMMTRDGLSLVLTAELSRMARAPLSLGLFVFVGRVPDGSPGVRATVADLGNGYLALMVTRDCDAESERALYPLVGAIAREDDFGGGGLVKIESGAAASFDAHSLLHAAECLLESVVQTAPRTLERIVIRRDRSLPIDVRPV